MTFSVLAKCERTGMFGMAIATRPIAIGAKCPFVRPHIGGLMVQANGDPRLGALGLKLLEMGYSAAKVLSELCESDGAENIEWRQIMVIDKDGNTAVRTTASPATGSRASAPRPQWPKLSRNLQVRTSPSGCCARSKLAAMRAGRLRGNTPQRCKCTTSAVTRGSICALTSMTSR